MFGLKFLFLLLQTFLPFFLHLVQAVGCQKEARYRKAVMLSARLVDSEHLRDVGENMYRTLAKVHTEEEEYGGFVTVFFSLPLFCFFFDCFSFALLARGSTRYYPLVVR
jgi:hypothetical protein